MAEQFTITGVVLPANGADRTGMKVQAFDRDMPSVERRTGAAPELLGDAITDAQGGFKIAYTLAQFKTGDGTSLFQRQGDKNADLSFRVFSQTGQELSITSIQGNRDAGPDQIIFNAPIQLSVNIFVNPPQAATSEFERLLNLITPIIEDVPLSQLTDEDIRFILSDLDAGQQGQIPQRIEWLRRCALLAQDTNLPVEAFYGWGRKDLPASFAELSAAPLKDLPPVIEKLSGLNEDRLRESLLAAIVEEIIPTSFRDRIDQIVRLLVRRNKVAREVIAQLLDSETNSPLAGFMVTTFDQEDAPGENSGVDITDVNGRFSLTFYVPGEMPANAPLRDFRLEIISPDGDKITDAGLLSIDLTKPETEIFSALIQIPKVELDKQKEELKSVLVDVPPELQTFLNETHNIQTLADIRKKGGLSKLAGLPGDIDSAQIRQLESLADLDRVSPDISVSKSLLSRNFDSVLAISDTPRSEFVGKLTTGEVALTETEAARLHVIAGVQNHLLDNMLMKIAADNANGFNAQNGDGDDAEADDISQQKCGCSDCQAAVSPGAYLTALLDYALKHIRNNKNKIDLQFLVDTFRQPFIDLPTDCEAVEDQLHQVRICVEVLRNYLGSRPLADPVKEAALVKAEAEYRFAVYALLLSRIGASYQEIRRVRGETTENRKALAARLGIDLTEPRLADELDQLFLDPGAQPPSDHLLTEQEVERLFGLGDTTRDPLSEGVKLGDAEAQITRWNLHGVKWGQNTDSDGLVHVTLVNPEPAVFRVELHQDALRTKLIASGEIATANGTVKLVPEANSRLSGVFEIAYTADSNVISLAAVPSFSSWQLKHLRTLWSLQDHPLDAYSDSASRLPLIDPDLIGPDDFRNPNPKTNPADPDKAFDIWLNRRQFVDTNFFGLKADREAKGLTQILKQVLGDPLPDLDSLFLVLTKTSTADEIKVARDTLATLELSVESFTRLMFIRAKDQLAQKDPGNEKVSEAEWRDVYSILVQVLKKREFVAWRISEEAALVQMGLEEFWLSVSEPREGDWPPLPVAGQPLVDPDVVKLTDLPDWLAGKDAANLWKLRKARLEQIPKDLKLEHETNGFQSMLLLALGHPRPGNPLQRDLDQLNAGLGSAEDAIRKTAATQIETDLHLSVESFKRLLAIKAANDQPLPAQKPGPVELAEVYAILAQARKLKHEYPAWILEENGAGLVYWKTLKAKLPIWRASTELRQAWQQALRVRSQSPIIDPTVMAAEDLQHVIPGDPAFDLWKTRVDLLTTRHDEMKAAREAVDPDTLAGLDQIIKDAIGIESTELIALDSERQEGHSIEKRLDQLNLVTSAFNYLSRIRGLAKAQQPIVESEWETVYDTLVRAKLQRESAKLRAEELDQKVSLSPDFFKIPAEVSTSLRFIDLSTPRWLSTWQARRDWQDLLQSRIDQETSIIDGLSSAVIAVEETALPALRDSLIEASDAAGANLSEQAEWITARLLIDARSGGCRMTTRVAQALETLQTLIYDLRTGQFRQPAPLSLSLVSDYFDEEWKWIGSYATWRSAMFVFLYPENILQPSLLKDKTLAFGDLVKTTRSPRINPQTACQKAESYAEYFRDVCSLEIEATCQASTIVYAGEGCDRQISNQRSMFYMFARSASGKVYWSAYDPSGNSGQTFWEEAPTLKGKKVSRIVGAMPYRKRVADSPSNKFKTLAGGDVQSAYIHLFCVTGEAGNKTLQLARLNLDEFGTWDTTLYPLSSPLPVVSTLEVIPVQTQNEFTKPGLVFHSFDINQFYFRTLNTDGTAWDPNPIDWPAFLNVVDITEKSKDGSQVSHTDLGWREIKAVLYVNLDIWFVTREHQDYYNVGIYTLRGKGLPIVRGVRISAVGERIIGVLPGREVQGTRASLAGKVESDIFLFAAREPGGSGYSHFTNPQDNHPINSVLADLTVIPPHSGSAAAGQQMLAYEREKNSSAFYMYRYTESGDRLVGSATIRAVPRVQRPLTVPLHSSEANLQTRRQEIAQAFALNVDAPATILQYLREAYYFVPLHLALALQSAGHHLAALDCFRTVYDYESQIGPPNQRNIYYGLELDANSPDAPLYQQADGWLLDPLNPHSIAATRHLAYTRFTIMSVVRCLLDFADSEFTQDTGESLARARTFYLTALDLLNQSELQQKLGVCDDLIAELRIQPGKDIPPQVPAAVAAILEDLTKGAKSFRKARKVTKGLKEVFVGDDLWDAKLIEARAVVQAAVAKAPLPLGTGSLVLSKSNILKEQHASLLAQPQVDETLQRVGKTVAENIFVGVGIVDPALPPIDKGQPPLPQPPLMAVITPSLEFCIPPNPILSALRLHAELNLFKLRTCRNIAGLKRQLDLYAAPTDTTSGLPAIGAGGQLVVPGVATLQPSLYRYPVLIERAKQLVQLAAQIEAAMLTAVERRDAETQNLLQARQQLGLAQAGVRLQDLRVGEAKDGVTLADLQKERSQIQIDTYDEWIETGPNEYEKQMKDAYATAAAAQKGATEASRRIQIKQAAISSANLAASLVAADPTGGVLAGGVGVANFAIEDQLFTDVSDDTKKAIDSAAAAQIASLNAAMERRQDEWQLQRRLAEQDSRIGEQLQKIADDHVQIVTQERAIAGIQADNAKDSVEFLTNKFTNVELFDWMSNILEGVYSFFLQQATAMAKLGENQLAFERQEVPPAYIKADYWNVPSETSVLGNTDGQGSDRHGLTGSARLLQDIYQLDQYAFSSNKRKLPLAKTISLSRLAPVEFQRFRETGVLPFATPMEMFDRGFPGHYLRLIKRVRTSVIALIPPIEGIHATLSTTGPSRVVIGGDIFQTVPIRRAPEFIAMSAPNNSTGVFELDPQPDMLLPFEGSGVEMSWEFKMPKAANRFDYGTIADVLITLEYTALDSVDYRQQVIQTLKPTVSSDRPFSFRNQFADQWYDLHNPEQTSAPMTVRFTTLREDFPPNVEALKIQHLVIYFIGANATAPEVPVSHLRYTPRDEPGAVGGGATSIDGIISTRRGNAGSWTTMIGKSPIGEWELALPNTEEMRKRFGAEDSNEAIQDILLVVTYSGRTPDWPN